MRPKSESTGREGNLPRGPFSERLGFVCVLRAYGTDFDPDDFLRSTELLPSLVFRRGEPQVPELEGGPPHEISGIHVTVSEAEWSSLVGQVRDAEHYLTTHKSELCRLATFPGLERISLDFPLDLRISQHTWMQTDTFPASLAKLAGEIGLDLELSLYRQDED
jgi:hypothetical protein